MSVQKICKKTKYYKGMYVKVVSCDKKNSNCQINCTTENPICTLEDRDDIFHCVKLERLKLYPPTSLVCEGKTDKTDHRKSIVKFKSLNPADSENYWKRSKQTVKKSYYVNDVKIVSEKKGKEAITTEVTVEWPYPGKPKTVKAKIRVVGFS